MASYYNKVRIETPVRKSRKFDLSCMHLTTANFMQTNIVYAREFPKTKIKCNLKSLARMAPLEKPVLGSVQVHSRAFWVPFRTVWSPWNSFIVDAPFVTDSGASIMTGVPTVDNKVLEDFIVSFSTLVMSSADPYDFSVGSANYKLLPEGRLFIKQLESLGYKIVFGAKADQIFYSAMPILCFAKVYFDYYLSAQYSNTGANAVVEGIFNRYFRYNLSVSDLESIFRMASVVSYDTDYFTSAYDSPVAPNSGTYSSSYQIPDITNNADSGSKSMLVTNDPTLSQTPNISSNLPTNGTPYIAGHPNVGFNTNVSCGVVTHYVNKSLQALSNYLHRHALVGARVLDRYIADFGVLLSAEKLRRCLYIGKQTFPIQFSDVMSNSDTNGAVLGDYAGKGVAFDGSGNFEFQTDEFGMFIILNSIVPDIAYYQGLDRQVLHKTRLEFLNGEFQKLGMQPISKAELIVSRKNASVNGLDQNQIPITQQIFGFTSRYAEYLIGRDKVTGDFLCDSLNRGLMGWSTARFIDDSASVTEAPAHSFAFTRGLDWLQYNRIFYGVNDEDVADKFYFVHRINITAMIEADRLFDTYEFDEDEGKSIVMQGNGVQVN